MWGKANARGLGRTTDREGALQSECTGYPQHGVCPARSQGGQLVEASYRLEWAVRGSRHPGTMSLL